MDGNSTHPLVVLPPDHGSEGSGPRQFIIGGPQFDDEAQDDLVDRLRHLIFLLCQLVLFLLSALRALRLQVIELRC